MQTITIIGSMAALLALQTFWIARGLDSLSGRIDRLSVRLDRLEARVDALAARLDSLAGRLDARLDSLADRIVTDHGERIARLEAHAGE